MKWFKEHKKVATIGLAGIFLLVLVLIGCGVAFSGSRNGSDQKEQEASVTEEKSSDTEVKKEDAAKEDVSEEKTETKEEAKKEEKTEKKDDTKKTGTASATATTKKMKRKLPPVSHPAVPARRRQRQKQITPVLPIAASRSIRIPG